MGPLPPLCPGKAQPPLISFTPRYTGHKNKEYKLDCCLSERDTHVVSCSEDGKVFFWDLVEVSLSTSTLHSLFSLSLPQSRPEKGSAIRTGTRRRAGKAFQQREQYVLRLVSVARIGQELAALQDGSGSSRSHIRHGHQCQAEPLGLTLRMRETNCDI